MNISSLNSKTSSKADSKTDSYSLRIICGLVILFLPLAVQGEDLTFEFETRHAACLQQIAEDPDLGFEEAMIWRDEGGGRRARHCIAMALFSLGHKEAAARRLDLLAKAPDGGSSAMRLSFHAEAANFWLIANRPKAALKSATAGLDIQGDDVPLRLARARAYALAGRYDYADIDLTSALVFEPENGDILRYRADARQHLGQLTEAKTDIDRAFELTPDSVETALLRGRIIEALRLLKRQNTEHKEDTELPD